MNTIDIDVRLTIDTTARVDSDNANETKVRELAEEIVMMLTNMPFVHSRVILRGGDPDETTRWYR